MNKLKTFLKDRRGATALTFALLLGPIMGATSLAAEDSLPSDEHSKLQHGSDSSALAGATVFTGANSQAAEARARAYLQANLGDQADKVTVTFNAFNEHVTVGIQGQTNTLFMHLLNR